MAVIAILGITIPSVIRANLSRDEYHNGARRALGMARWIIGCVALVVVLISTIIGGVKIIDQTEVGVVKTFGRVDHTISGGLNFVNPISDTIEVMDLRVHVREASFASYTKDAQPLTAAIEYQYEPDASRAMDIVKQYGSYEIMETKLGPPLKNGPKLCSPATAPCLCWRIVPPCPLRFRMRSRNWKRCFPSTSPKWL